MGQMIEVEIIECEKFSMKGKILNQDKLSLDRPIIKPTNGLRNLNQLNKNKTNSSSNKETSCCNNQTCECENESSSSCCSSENHKTKSAELNSYFQTFAYGALIALSITFIWRNLRYNNK